MATPPESTATSGYAETATRLVPGLRDLHTMASVLLAERAPAVARILVLGAGGGMELKAFAERQPAWRFDGVDPSDDMLQLARTAVHDVAARVQLHHGYIDQAPNGPFDGATCLLMLHFLHRAERLATLRAIRSRLTSRAPLVIVHHSFPGDGPGPDLWLRRNAAYGIASGIPAAQAERSIAAIRERLPVLSPTQEVDLLAEAGFVDIELFYCAFTFKGWVAYNR